MRARRLGPIAAGVSALLIVIGAFGLFLWNRPRHDTVIPSVSTPEGEGVTVLTRLVDTNTVALRSPTFR